MEDDKTLEENGKKAITAVNHQSNSSSTYYRPLPQIPDWQQLDRGRLVKLIAQVEVQDHKQKVSEITANYEQKKCEMNLSWSLTIGINVLGDLAAVGMYFLAAMLSAPTFGVPLLLLPVMTVFVVQIGMGIRKSHEAYRVSQLNKEKEARLLQEDQLWQSRKVGLKHDGEFDYDKSPVSNIPGFEYTRFNIKITKIKVFEAIQKIEPASVALQTIPIPSFAKQ